MTENQMMVSQELSEENFASQLANAQSIEGSMWTNYELETKEDKATFFQAITMPDKRLSEVINVPFNLTAVYVDTARCTDEKGNSYATGSICIFSDLKKLFGFIGFPTKEKPQPVVVKQIEKGTKRFFHICLAK